VPLTAEEQTAARCAACQQPLREPRLEIEFPRIIRLSGVLALICSSLLLLNAAVSGWLTVATFVWAGPSAGGCAAPLAGCTGLLCFILGKLLVRGRSTSASHLGIVAILSGLLDVGWGVLLDTILLTKDQSDLLFFDLPLPLLSGGAFWYRHLEDRNWAVILGSLGLIAGVGLITAGMLALAGRKRYQQWRRARYEVA
jgi:hypothetical protein